MTSTEIHALYALGAVSQSIYFIIHLFSAALGVAIGLLIRTGGLFEAIAVFFLAVGIGLLVYVRLAVCRFHNEILDIIRAESR